jgi:hypothetical protein
MLASYKYSALCTGNHILPVADIRLDAWRAAAVRSMPVHLIRPVPPPPRAASSVEEDPHILVSRETARQRLPMLWLVLSHDYQDSRSCGRQRFRGPVFD